MRGPQRAPRGNGRGRGSRSTSSRRSRSSRGPQVRLDLGGPVHEPRLVDVPDRIRLAEGGNRHDGDPVELAQTRQRLAESRLALAEVGPEADVGARPRSHWSCRRCLYPKTMRPGSRVVFTGSSSLRSWQRARGLRERRRSARTSRRERALDRALAHLPTARATDPRGATRRGFSTSARARWARLTPSERRQAAVDPRPADRTGTTARLDRLRTSARKHLLHGGLLRPLGEEDDRDAPSLGGQEPQPTSRTRSTSVRSVMTTVWNKEINALSATTSRCRDELLGRTPRRQPEPEDRHLPPGRRQVRALRLLHDRRPEVLASGATSRPTASSTTTSRRSSSAGAATGVAALKVTAAHEFNHAIQFSYDVREDRWFMEATGDEHGGDGLSAPSTTTTSTSGEPALQDGSRGVPIDLFQPNGSNQYGAWIFFRFLLRDIHAAPDRRPAGLRGRRSASGTAAEVTPGTKSGGTYSTKAIADTLTGNGKDFVDLFRQFGAADGDPAAFYKDGALYSVTAGSMRRSTAADRPDRMPGCWPYETIEAMYPHVERLRREVKPGSAHGRKCHANHRHQTFRERPIHSARDGRSSTTTSER